MKRRIVVLAVLCLSLCLAARAEGSRVLLYSAYQQQGWGDRVQVCCVDADGGLWTLEGSASGLKWPASPEEQVQYLAETANRTSAGTIRRDGLIDLKTLVESVEDRGRRLSPGGYLDYGTAFTYAARYDGDGAPSCVLLYAYGDSMFVNTDANAQGLCFALNRLFSEGMSDAEILEGLGVQPIPLSTFCGYDPAILEQAQLTAVYNDCEEGPLPVELTDAEARQIRDLVKNGVVRVKANAIETTGDFYSYIFRDDSGNYLASIGLYEGKLVGPDGMYYIGIGA